MRTVLRHGTRDDTVARRLGILVAVVLTLLLIVGAVGVTALLLTGNVVGTLTSGYAPAADENSAALQDMLNAETSVRGYALSHGRRAFLAPYRHSAGRVLPSLDAAEAALNSVGDHSCDSRIALEERRARQWLDQVAAPIARQRDPSTALAVGETGRKLFERFRAVNTSVSATVLATRTRLRARSHQLRTVALPIMAGAALVALALATWLGLRNARSVSRPLRALRRVVARIESGDLAARADPDSGPVDVRAVSAAVNRLGETVERNVAEVRAAAALRQRTRTVTARLRAGVDAQATVDEFVAGLGTVFSVDRAWLHTFADGGSAEAQDVDGEHSLVQLTSQWNGDGLEPVPPRDEERLRAVQVAAGRLWHDGVVIGIADHDDPGADADPAFADGAALLGARASVFAVIGDSGAAFGLLWLAMVDGPREWTTSELGVVHRVVTELAQSLVQIEVLTRQREAVERMREADEAKTALVSTVSHEFRTPLTSILGYLEVLLDDDGQHLPRTAVSMLRVVERNAMRLRGMIEDLLTQSQIEAGRLRLVPRQLDLAEVLRDVAETMRPLAEASELTLRIDAPPAGDLVTHADVRQISQAVTNLVANAIKFTRPGGWIELWAGERVAVDGAARAAVRVTDTGIGIPAEDVPHLFERFFRASNAMNARTPGTGLGMPILQEIVHRHGGEVRVESELGSGTSVEILLPIRTAGTVEHG